MKILLDEFEIRKGIHRLAAQLNERYSQQTLTIVSIMTGSLVMLADLIRCLEMPVRISLIQASSYRGTMTSGELRIQDQMMLDISGQVSSRLLELQPRSLRTAVFLNKSGQSVVSAKPDYVVFEIPNAFVVGYGLDYEDLYRNLPHVAILEPSDIEKHPSS